MDTAYSDRGTVHAQAVEEEQEVWVRSAGRGDGSASRESHGVHDGGVSGVGAAKF
jgi:hypothetical protein